jgi:hypothetical protein
MRLVEMKKHLIASLLLLASPLVASAQSAPSGPKPIPSFRSNGAENAGFGIKGGVNFNSLQGDGVKKLYAGTSSLTQFHVGAYAQFGVSNWFSIQPELLYQRKGFKSSGEILPDSSKLPGSTTRLNYVSLPLLFVFNVFDNLAIQVGPQASYLFGVRNGSESLEASTYNYNTFDIGAVGGIEAKLEFLRFGARYDYSLTDLRKAGNFSVSNVSRRAEADIRSGVFQVYLGLGL